MASPLSRMIFSSSSADHLDCFLAGDSDEWMPCCLFVGTIAAAVKGVDSAVVDASVVVGTDPEGGDPEGGEAGAEVVDRASSSSCLRSREISTLLVIESKAANSGDSAACRAYAQASEKTTARCTEKEELNWGRIQTGRGRCLCQCYVTLVREARYERAGQRNYKQARHKKSRSGLLCQSSQVLANETNDMASCSNQRAQGGSSI